MKNKYLTLASKNLSNNFTGGQGMSNSISDITNAISNKFGVQITSTATTPISVAVLPSYYKTLGIDTAGTPAVSTPHYHNKADLTNAGIMVDAIIDDGTWALGDPPAGNVTIFSTDPSKKIRDFLEHIKHYTRSLSKIMIHSSNIAAYRNSIKLQMPNPFNDSQRVPIDLNQYFDPSQYQDDKIILDFSGIDLAVTPDLLMLMTIPAQSTVVMDMFFR